LKNLPPYSGYILSDGSFSNRWLGEGAFHPFPIGTDLII
jgi:hypothetical protein